MRLYAAREGMIPAPVLRLFEDMSRDVLRMPDLASSEEASCHVVCRALALLHPEVAVVDGHFMRRGNHHAWLRIGRDIVADMYPIGGAVPFIVDAGGYTNPWGEAYVPDDRVIAGKEDAINACAQLLADRVLSPSEPASKDTDADVAAIDDLVASAWRWGMDCEVDGLDRMDRIGDSHIESRREDTARLAARISSRIRADAVLLSEIRESRSRTRLALERMRAERDVHAEVVKALLGTPVDDETESTLGRFNWLHAMIITFGQIRGQNPAFNEAWLGEDPSSAFECEREVEMLLAETRPLLQEAIRALRRTSAINSEDPVISNEGT